MKLSVLAALLASCDAVQQESKQHQLVGTKSKFSAETKDIAMNLKKQIQKSQNIKLVEIKEQAECGNSCTPPPSSSPVFTSPSPMPIAGIPTPSGCLDGQHLSNGTCVADEVKDPLTPHCPSGFFSDSYGNCLPTPASYPTKSPLLTCA